jgi:transcriptional regulator with GAF, ATPase, and Fis domain
MTAETYITADSGLEVVDILSDPAFQARALRFRDSILPIEGMDRLACAFVDHPETILQELVDAAIILCGADSAGISLEREDATDDNFYHWVATAGTYAPFLNAALPRYPSACGVCLERGRPQNFRVDKRFFDILGVEAANILDGILLPWQVDETRGTIFIMSHHSSQAFDADDVRVMQVLANFAAMGVRHQRQQQQLQDQAAATAIAAMANDLAHKINNPLQSLTNIVYLASGSESQDAKALASELDSHLRRLSTLSEKLLKLPVSSLH